MQPQIGQYHRTLQARNITVTLNHVNPAELFYFNFQPFEVLSRYRDPQPQAVENYAYLFDLKPNMSYMNLDV